MKGGASLHFTFCYHLHQLVIALKKHKVRKPPTLPSSPQFSAEKFASRRRCVCAFLNTHHLPRLNVFSWPKKESNAPDKETICLGRQTNCCGKERNLASSFIFSSEKETKCHPGETFSYKKERNTRSKCFLIPSFYKQCWSPNRYQYLAVWQLYMQFISIECRNITLLVYVYTASGWPCWPYRPKYARFYRAYPAVSSIHVRIVILMCVVLSKRLTPLGHKLKTL